MNSLGVIGLGLMGTAITERLLEHRWKVTVWNRTREKAAPLIDRGAVWSENPIADCEIVLLSLYSSQVVDEVIGRLGHALRPGQILVDTTTGEPSFSEALGQRLDEKVVRYLDAPISGSSEQTRRGEATVMVGGALSAYHACSELWKILGKHVYHLGPNGSAARMKLITNLVLGLNRAVLAEGLAFAAALGVEPAQALEVLTGSMAYSRAMDVKGRKMIEGDFSVQARLSQHLKDVCLMLNAASEARLPLPFTATHRELLERAEAAGYGDLDNSAILKVLAKPKAP